MAPASPGPQKAVLTEVDLEELKCFVCGEGFSDDHNALCGNCGHCFHIPSTPEADAKVCGSFNIDRDSFMIVAMCNLCLSRPTDAYVTDYPD